MLAIFQLLLIFTFALAVQADDAVQIYKSTVSSYVLHLSEGADVITALTNLLAEKPHQAITMISAVGKVHGCSLWRPNSSKLVRYNNVMQFTSIAGNIDQQLTPNIWAIFRDDNQAIVSGKFPTLARRKQEQANGAHAEKHNCLVQEGLKLTVINHDDLKFKRDVNSEGTPLKIIEI